jgi:hypothetical protein
MAGGKEIHVNTSKKTKMSVIRSIVVAVMRGTGSGRQMLSKEEEEEGISYCPWS